MNKSSILRSIGVHLSLCLLWRRRFVWTAIKNQPIGTAGRRRRQPDPPITPRGSQSARAAAASEEGLGRPAGGGVALRVGQEERERQRMRAPPRSYLNGSLRFGRFIYIKTEQRDRAIKEERRRKE